jgi:hypothetical protein
MLLHCVAGFVLGVIISLSAPAAAETDGEAALDARVVELYRLMVHMQEAPVG